MKEYTFNVNNFKIPEELNGIDAKARLLKTLIVRNPDLLPFTDGAGFNVVAKRYREVNTATLLEDVAKINKLIEQFLPTMFPLDDVDIQFNESDRSLVYLFKLSDESKIVAVSVKEDKTLLVDIL